MPFELGLAAALQKARVQRHEWFVFEERRHRLSKSLSDLNGTDPYIHGGKAEGVLRALTNALVRARHQPTVTELRAILADLETAAVAIKVRLQTQSLFEARPFKELVVAARRSAQNRIGSFR